MFNIEVGHEAIVEAVVDCHKLIRATRWSAASAWWLARRNILQASSYWNALAAKMTNELGEVDREAMIAQLRPAEIAMLDAATDWPQIPDDVTSMLDMWNPEPNPIDTDLLVRIYSDAIQGALNTKARERQYDSIQSAITYRDDPNPKFAAEAEALFQWRSLVWTYSTTLLARVLAGEVEMPSVEEFLEGIPAFTWPE